MVDINMKLVITPDEAVDIEVRTERAARFLLALVWETANQVSTCPICLMEIMYDMMNMAEERGDIQHANLPEDDTMGEPVTSTVQ